MSRCIVRLRADVTGLQAEVARLSRGLSRLEAREGGSPPGEAEPWHSWWRQRLAETLGEPVDSERLLQLLRDRLAGAPPPSVLQAYRALHRATEAWGSTDRLDDKESDDSDRRLLAALRALEKLGVHPGPRQPAPVHDDVTLDARPTAAERGPRPRDQYLYCRVCQALHVEEDSVPVGQLASMVLGRCQLYDRLADPEAYDVADPDALANVVLTALGTVRSQSRQLEQLADELVGLRQELADMVDAEHGTDPDIVLGQVNRRTCAMQRLIECYKPEQLRAVAAGLHGFCAENHSPGCGVADMLDIAAQISEEENA